MWNQGLGEKAFYRWRRKEREAVASATSSLTLVPVSVSALVNFIYGRRRKLEGLAIGQIWKPGAGKA